MIPLLLALALACTGADEPDPVDTAETEATVDTTPVDTGPTDTDPCLARGEPTLTLFSWRDRVSEPKLLRPDEPLEIVRALANNWGQDLAIRVQNVPRTVRADATITRVSDGTLLLDPIVRLQLELTPWSDPPWTTVPPLTPWECDGWSAFTLSYDRALLGDPLVGDFSGVCGEEVDVTVSLRTVDEALLGSATIRARLQPDRCDCSWCGGDAPATPVCVSQQTYADDCYDDQTPVCARALDTDPCPLGDP